ncbi:MAG: NAD-glutamate dehydrogenase [Alphaproteobacteria bacterium]|nr:NAD-glutamate dehydrogenase [Alphaproteobacteria bacterium]
MPDDKKLKAFLSSITRKLGGNASGLLKAFAMRIYEDAHLDDLKEFDAGALADGANDSLEFFRAHRPGRAGVRVVNPAIAGLADVTVIQVSNDDMPFLLDSVLGALNDRGLEIRLVLHPIIATRKDRGGGILEVLPHGSETDTGGVVRESLIQIFVERIELASEHKDLERILKYVLDEVRFVVTDWKPMQGALRALIQDYQNMPPPIAVDELAEALEFMQWLLDDHFTLMGVRSFDFTGSVSKGDLKPKAREGFGLLRNPDVQVLRRGADLVSYTPELVEFMGTSAPLIITKANVRSNVHRRAHMDFIGIKRFNDDGKLVGELRVVGLFTSTAYTRSPRFIPILRRRLNQVIKLSRFNPDSHSGKALINVLETYPRDELFQIEPELLGEIADGIMQLDERPRPRLFIRVDKFDRFASVLAFFPRDRYTSDVRATVGEMLANVYEGVVSAFYPSFPEGSLVRVHYIIGHRAGKMPRPSTESLEQRMVELIRTWDDRLSDAIADAVEPAEAAKLQRNYNEAFSVSYQAAYEPEQAIKDIGRIKSLDDGSDIALVLYRPKDVGADRVNLKLYHLGDPIRLSDRLPILEQLGLKAIDERTFTIRTNGASYVLHDIALQTADGNALDLDARGTLLEEAFQAVWTGQAENDGYNNLILKAGLTWRETALLRTLGRYLRQAGIPYSDHYLWQALIRHVVIAGNLWSMFEARFAVDSKADKTRSAAENKIAKRIETALADVPSLDDDRILWRFMNLIQSSLRTNFYQTDDQGNMRPTIAIKINSSLIDELPEPRPYREIFVYAPDVEGIHLRGGPIARGGLRWSDRPEDFRTEVLGLAKAQQVKNAVIVPVGAKGGFVPKNLNSDMSREEFLAEGVRCYKLFITSLVQITDNLRGVKVIPPKGVVRHDGDDPYLVVAADKGTATFSDIANSISEDHDFWLGDAFASGGSAGYDHKKMGITARGGWEAVKRNFREMDIDIQTQPFTAIGCGDMSGDVFGNGMLLSKATKLIAAFDHRDIFIDPDPDPAKSWAERNRMFKLPRSSWQDYNTKLMSKGGGIFPRTLKTIPLSPEIKAMTGLTAKSCTPNELIKALLKSSCDLLWFGGIGTYVRATHETDADVGDRTNDILRITAPEVGAKVVGEGANLGFTQLARIEFDIHGGLINSDAIDNSAGVNSSDVEVNIKIALGAAEQAGKLSRKARNQLLEKMTDEVAELVLRNNYLQSLAITMALEGGDEEFGFLVRMMQALEANGDLDREVEDLPDNVELAERQAAGKVLTRPEIAVLMAYAKLVLFEQLQASGISSEPYFARELSDYFPGQMRKKYEGEIKGHRLGSEIISTVLANDMINMVGPAFVNRLLEETGAGVADLARSFAAATDVLNLTEIRAEVDALDNKIASETQISLYDELQTALRRQMTWFARNGDWSKGIQPVVTHYGKALTGLAPMFSKVLPERQRERVAEFSDSLKAQKVPAGLAAKISDLRFLSRSSDVALVASRTGKPLKDVGQASFAMAHELGIDQIVSRTMQISARDHYERIAINRAVDSVFLALRAIVMQTFSARSKGPAMDNWIKANSDGLNQARNTVNDMVSGSEFTLARLTLAASALGELAAD